MPQKALSAISSCALLAIFVTLLFYSGREAYKIRLYAIKTYGRVIHEFDPWFNFRATKYLADNGWQKFFTWFDYESWYPLGRPVGTTIYPGMQITSVWIWQVLGSLDKKFQMSLNDVCVFVPAWFGVSATVFLGLLAKECTGSNAVGGLSAAIMAVVPAHLMRSVGGGYDNESIAMTAMCMTFFCWCRALRPDPSVKDGHATRDSYLWGTLAGFAYVYMVAAWGGFVFVVNMVGAHAAALFFLCRYTSKLHRAYSLFYVIGTLGAMRVPVVGWSPLKSTEQLAPLLVFFALQILEYVEVQRRKRQLSMVQVFLLRVKVTLPLILGAASVAFFLQTRYNYFGPPSARVRGLFVKHTRTGNPLVDSVAEHQPANAQAYQQYLHNVYDIAPYGFLLSFFRWSDANAFLILYAVIAYYFSSKMARLVILLGPVASVLGGVLLGMGADQLLIYPSGKLIASFLPASLVPNDDDDDDDDDDDEEGDDNANGKGRKGGKGGKGASGELRKLKQSVHNIRRLAVKFYNFRLLCVLRIALGIYLARQCVEPAKDFYKYTHELAEQLSQPSIMFKARLNNGKEIMVDDYREAYWWLAKRTPPDARVMAWWDYGYQIAGIGNRTTIADGNTWNHEHIATLGRILSAPEDKAHRIARHLADYVLVWAGGGGDDLAKSPHMARIGNSVYHDICPEPTCSQFGFYQGGIPTPMMEKCLLYKTVRYGEPGVPPLSPKRFQHAFTSKYGKVRIFKVMNVSLKSKKWVADPANRVCDAPGSWYCVGQYPPALSSLIAKRKPFKQLEDFNVERSEEDKRYVDEYHRRMEGNRGRGEYDDYGGEMGDDPYAGMGDAASSLGIAPVGCFGRESELGSDKVYTGGKSGSQLALALQWAGSRGKKYAAIAKASSVDGHVFAFNELPDSSSDLGMDEGCDAPCEDIESLGCGCADGVCRESGAAKLPGEDNARRWIVYAVPAEFIKKPAARKTGKGKSKKSRPPKSEL